jgi:hypothetical protein
MLAVMETPIDDRWFEDYKPGGVYEYGSATLTADELVDFAMRFDPQPIHIDPVYAAAGPFGGLIASGWHTAGLMMRLLADNYLSKVTSPRSRAWPRPASTSCAGPTRCARVTCSACGSRWSRPGSRARSPTAVSSARRPSCSTRTATWC